MRTNSQDMNRDEKLGKSPMRAVDKLWGKEIWIINCKQYCGKLLYLDKEAQTSWHAHPQKQETLYGFKGTASLRIESEMHLLTPFNLPKTIFPGQFHSFSGITDAVILEVSTHHSDDDVRRLTQSQPGIHRVFSSQIVISVDRDGVLVWGNPSGPITASDLLELKDLGFVVGTGGGAPAEEQLEQWMSNGVQPDFALSKGDLLSLRERYVDAELIHVDNEPVVIYGFRVITPEELKIKMLNR